MGGEIADDDDLALRERGNEANLRPFLEQKGLYPHRNNYRGFSKKDGEGS